MINVTEKASEQISVSAQQSGIEDATLRIAVKKNPDNTFHYAMGFDSAINEDDYQFESNGIKIVVSPKSIDLADGMTLDYVQLEDQQYNFIFQNPKDPNYIPPSE